MESSQYPPHLLLFPVPAQGHIVPLMKLAQTLAIHGLNITFVNTQTNHHLISTTINENGDGGLSHRIRLVSMPDLDNELQNMHQLRPLMLEKLISELNEKEGNDPGSRITCLLADCCADWVLDVGWKMGIKTATFVPFAAANLVLFSNIQNLINNGIIDEEGFLLKKESIEFSLSVPSINIEDLVWMRMETMERKKTIFNLVKRINEKERMAQWTIINTTQSLEPAALSLVPQARSVGPLLSGNQPTSGLWLEDLESLRWLDQQSPNSVIYAAFGSTTIFNQDQFLQLAIGLELTNRPFLWVIRSGSIKGDELECTEGVLQRVGTRGKVVRWASQVKVLGHPSIACFFTHCGWNSTIEGINNGLPLLCWPYLGDQFMNQNYICNVWRIGLGFDKKGEEIITKDEIKDKIETLVSDKSFKARALELKESTLSCGKERGSSYKNLLDFVEWVRN